MTIGRSGQPSEPVRALSFGSVADEYERYRHGYPDALFDAVAHYARRPLRRALEIGAGTGKATRLFAAQGVAVTALEPDAAMADVLERTTRGLPVETVVSTFEDFTPARPFDLVFAAAAWHWTDPSSRSSRAVAALDPGGVLAVFGAPTELKDPALRAAVEEVERRVLTGFDPSESHPWSPADVALDGLGDVVQQDLPRLVTTTVSDFAGRLSTVSAYLSLGPVARADALRQVRAVLPARFDLDVTVQLALARRRPMTGRQ